MKIETINPTRPKRQHGVSAAEMLPFIIDGIMDCKGEHVICMDLTNLDDAMADYFVICHANTPTQMRAIADSVVEKLEKEKAAKPMHVEGLSSTEWILVDYFDVVVHVFQTEKRDLFQLEELWADAAVTTEYAEDGTSKVLHYSQPVPESYKKKR